MDVDKIVPNDPRVERKQAEVRGKTYSYLFSKPNGTPRGTVVLIHGWPDLSFGWRYQFPFFLSLGYRVVAPDGLGYGHTSSPEKLEEWTLKNMSDDIKALCEQIVPGEQIILGGHDWGGALIWRVTVWHPDLIKGAFSICTPYLPPNTAWFDLADIIAAGHLPNFKYQLQLRGTEVEEKLTKPEDIRQFLHGLFGGRGPNGEVAFSTERGVIFENLDKVGPSPMLSEEEIAYYAENYIKSGLRGPLNWYRTRRLNYEDEMPLAEKAASHGGLKVTPPSLFIAASKDEALMPSLAVDMERHFVSLTRGTVTASHWALWEAPGEVNKLIKQWLATKVDKDPAASL